MTSSTAKKIAEVANQFTASTIKRRKDVFSVRVRYSLSSFRDDPSRNKKGR